MASTAKRKPERRTRRHAHTGTSTLPGTSRPEAPRVIPVGDGDAVGAAEIEAGMPGAPDVAETARPRGPRPDRELAELAGGDLDAAPTVYDGGEGAVGGSDPTPDQDNVDEIGAALGVQDPDEQPIATTERIAARDRDRWELDPASSEDYEEREHEEAVRRRRRQP
jgi:Family of unknown function (DUF6335)